MKNRLNAVIDQLPRLEAEVIRMRFGLTEEGEVMSTDQVGALLGFSKERVRQTQIRALKRLRNEFIQLGNISDFI